MQIFRCRKVQINFLTITVKLRSLRSEFRAEQNVDYVMHLCLRTEARLIMIDQKNPANGNKEIF